MLRDYLTDLFPIMELGTSAKMLSVVPLLDGGGLFETGAGGSAPKHVTAARAGRTTCAGTASASSSRWRSASSTSPSVTGNASARRSSADTLDRATGTLPREDKSPGAQVGTIDNRGSHFYLAQYWAEELAGADRGHRARGRVRPARRVAARRRGAPIVDELIAVQGSPVDIGGYYHPDAAKTSAVMRPSATLNAALAAL